MFFETKIFEVLELEEFQILFKYLEKFIIKKIILKNDKNKPFLFVAIILKPF